MKLPGEVTVKNAIDFVKREIDTLIKESGMDIESVTVCVMPNGMVQQINSIERGIVRPWVMFHKPKIVMRVEQKSYHLIELDVRSEGYVAKWIRNDERWSLAAG